MCKVASVIGGEFYAQGAGKGTNLGGVILLVACRSTLDNVSAMEITYELTERDFREAFVAHRNARLAFRLATRMFGAGMVLLLLASVLAGILLPGGRQTLQSLMPVYLLFGAIVLVIWLGPWQAARSQFRGQPAARGPKTLTTTDSGMEWEGTTAKSEVHWPAYVRWCESNSMLLIYPSPALFVIVPKRAFTPEQLAEFRQLLEQNIGPVNKQRKVESS